VHRRAERSREEQRGALVAVVVVETDISLIGNFSVFGHEIIYFTIFYSPLKTINAP